MHVKILILLKLTTLFILNKWQIFQEAKYFEKVLCVKIVDDYFWIGPMQLF